MRRTGFLSILAILAIGAACSDPNQLLPATEVNFVDTLTLGALRGTPIQTPSAYAVDNGAGPDRPDLRIRFCLRHRRRRGVTCSCPGRCSRLAVDSSFKPGVQPRAETFDSIPGRRQQRLHHQ